MASRIDIPLADLYNPLRNGFTKDLQRWFSSSAQETPILFTMNASVRSMIVFLFFLLLAIPGSADAALSASMPASLVQQVSSVTSSSASASFAVSSMTPSMVNAAQRVEPAQNSALSLIENPTEGGFVFFNRQLITATLGKSRQVLLTFDDGPHPVNTPYVLDVLKRLNLKAIFFLVGTNVRKYPEIVRRISQEGHTIGNHTYFHPNLRQCAPDRILREIRDNNELIRSITGVKPTLFRPPYGGLSAKALDILRQENMSVMLWSVDPGDWRNRNIQRTVTNLKRQLAFDHGGKGGVVLLHDTLPSSAHALEPFLQALMAEGLLPAAYGSPAPKSRNFWAMRDPSLTGWQETIPAWRVENLRRVFLSSVVRSSSDESPSPMAMLRAKKAGNFLRFMLCQSLY